MARQTTDQLYIELDYYYPEEFYVYTAEAQADLSCTSTIDCTISNVRGADLTAFSDAALTAQVEVTRDVQATITATATIDQFVGDLYALRSASLTSEFAQTIDANRLREPQIALSSEFVFDAIVSINGAVVGSGTFTATASLDITPELYKDMGANLYADAVMDPDGVQRIRDVDSTQQAEFTQSLTFTKIVQGDCAFNALFAPSMTVEAVRNAFAVLDSTSALAVVAVANRSADIALSSIVNQSLQGDRFRDYVVNANSEFALSVEYVNTVPAQATLTSQTSIADVSTRVRYAQATITGAFTPSISVSLTKQGQISLSSTFTQSATVRRNRFATASISSAFSITNNVTEINQRQAFVAGLDLTYYRPLPGDGGNYIDQGFQDCITDQFGFVYSVGIEVTNESGPAGTVGNLIITKHDPRGKLVWQKAMTNQYGGRTGSNGGIYTRVALYNNYLFVAISGYATSSNPSTITYLQGKIYRFDLTTDLTTPNVIFPDQVITDMKIQSGGLYTNGFKLRVSGGNILQTNVVSRYNTSTMARLWSNGYGYSSEGSYRVDPVRTRFEVNSSGIFCVLVSDPSVPENTEKGAIYKLNLAGTVQNFYLLNYTPTSLAIDTSGNIYVSGFDRYNDGTNINWDYVLVKYDSTFVRQWAKLLKRNSRVIGQANQNDNGEEIHNIRINTDNNIVVANTEYLYSLNSVTLIKTIDSSGTHLKTGQLKILTNTSSTQTNATMTSFDMNIDSNNWMQLGSKWLREKTSTYPTTDKIEGIVYQIKADLSTSSFTARVYEPYSDNANYYLNYTVSNINNSLTDYAYIGTITSATQLDFAGSTSGQPDVDYSQAINYTEIPLYITSDGQASITSQSALTANNRRLRSTTVQLTAQASITANAVRTARTPAQLTAEATIVPNGGYIKGGTANLTSTATVTASLGLIKRHSATLSTQAVLNTTVRKYAGNGASLFPVITTTINNSRIRSFSSTITALGSELAAVNKIGRGLIQLDSVAQQTTAAVKTVQAHIDSTAVATQVADVRKIVKPSANIEARATFSVQALKIPATPVFMESAFAQTTETNNSKTTRITANISTSSQQSVNAVKTARPITTLSTQFAQTFGNQVTRLRLADSQQSVVATVLPSAVKTARTASTMSAFNTVLAVGTKISFDPDLQLTVPKEYSIVHVLEENTLLTVNPETRVNMVRMTI